MPAHGRYGTTPAQRSRLFTVRLPHSGSTGFAHNLGKRQPAGRDRAPSYVCHASFFLQRAIRHCPTARAAEPAYTLFGQARRPPPFGSAPPMIFEHSPKVKELQARLATFLDETIYPQETTYYEQLAEGGRWQIPPILE